VCGYFIKGLIAKEMNVVRAMKMKPTVSAAEAVGSQGSCLGNDNRMLGNLTILGGCFSLT
jgi:hypothetical protein